MKKEYLQNKYKYALNKTKELINLKKEVKQNLMKIKKALKLAKEMPKQYSNSLIGNIKEDKKKEMFKLKKIQSELTYYSTYLKLAKGKDDFKSYKKIDNKVKAKIQKLNKEEMEYKFFDFKIPVLKYLLLETGDINIVKTESYNFFYKQEVNKINKYTTGISKKTILEIFDTMEEAKAKAKLFFKDKTLKKDTEKIYKVINKLKLELDVYIEKYKENKEEIDKVLNKIKELN